MRRPCPLTEGENYRPIRNGHFNTRLISLKDGNLVGVFDARTRPSSNNYREVTPGLYWAIPGKHSLGSPDGYSAFRVHNGKEVPATLNGISSPASGVNIHHAGLADKTTLTNDGSPISKACSMLPELDFNSLRDFYFSSSNKLNGISIFPDLKIFTIYAGH